MCPVLSNAIPAGSDRICPGACHMLNLLCRLPKVTSEKRSLAGRAVACPRRLAGDCEPYLAGNEFRQPFQDAHGIRTPGGPPKAVLKHRTLQTLARQVTCVRIRGGTGLLRALP